MSVSNLLNKKIVPYIPCQGSVGASGDLAPLSHLALVFSNDKNDLESQSGYAEYQGEILSGAKAMQKAGIPRIDQLGYG